MFITRDFPVFEDGQSRVLGFDLTAVLSPGETIVSATATLIVWCGADAALALNPNARFIGSVLISGAVVTQGIVLNDPTGLLIGNIYALRIAVVTSLGQAISPWARFQVTHGFGAAALSLIFLTSDSGIILTDDSGNPLTVDGGSGAPLALAQIIVLPTAAMKLTIPGLSGFAGQNYPLADVGESWLYAFDYATSLSPNETIVNAVPSLTLVYGSDPVLAANPLVYFSRSPVISGSVVQQLVRWPLPLPDISGNIYVFGLNMATNFNQAMSVWSRVALGVGFASQAVLQAAA